MGGAFSGFRGSKKRVVESCDTIDMADFNRWELLVPGTDRTGRLEWRRGGQEEPYSALGYTLTVGRTVGVLRLRYQFGPPVETLDYSVRLVTTGCHLGGARWWLVCPLNTNGVPCGRRVRKVYRCGKYFGCRTCGNLTYTSQQKSDSRVYELARSELGGITDVRDMPVSQMVLVLKALDVQKKRLNRLLK